MISTARTCAYLNNFFCAQIVVNKKVCLLSFRQIDRIKRACGTTNYAGREVFSFYHVQRVQLILPRFYNLALRRRCLRDFTTCVDIFPPSFV